MSKQAETAVKFLQVVNHGIRREFILGNGFKLVIDASDYPEEIQEQLRDHGAEQKLRDSCAGLSKTNDYAAAQAALESIHEGLLKGEWSRKAQGLGYRQEDVINGLMAFKGMSFDQADGLIRNGDAKKIREHLKKNVKFNAAVAQAAADRIAKAAESADQADAEEAFEDLDFTADE